jgi:hypothetical protein
LALALKMPVHSIAMSTPSSFHGSFDGSRSAETLILPLPTLIESPSTVTVPGKRPCTESKAQQMGIGLDRAEIVDPDHFDILAAGFRNRPQDIAADAAKSVDRDADCHAGISLNSWRHPPVEGSTEVLTADRPVRPDENGQDEVLGSPFSSLAQPLPVTPSVSGQR